MSLRLYDTAARDEREFVPYRPGRVAIYVCGATVQSDPHIGHVRSAVAFDILRRWLMHTGYDVTFIRNVTDIDDKILIKSAEAGIPWWAWADLHERAFDSAYRTLGVLDPTYSPRATGHLPEMIELMERLIDSGHAYAPGDGDVYFDVNSWSDYGALSRQRLGEMQEATDSSSNAKHDPRDFALWKGAKAGGPPPSRDIVARGGAPTWSTPWGRGRPGWHLECSAMAAKYCGPEFDIHGGGLDLVFPHHENEIAQSRAAGDPFARYWMHNGWVTAQGEKMSKSLGNSLLVSEMVKQVRPVELRYYLGSAHYRSMLEFSVQALSESAAGFRRIESFVRRAGDLVGQVSIVGADVPPAFAAALDDDLGVPAALAVLHEAVTHGNEALTSGTEDEARAALVSVRAMAAILGFDPMDPQWQGHADTRGDRALDVLVQRLLEQRADARRQKDFATADTIRNTLLEVGLAIEDGPSVSSWSFDEGR